VVDGVGRILTIAVGPYSLNGKTMVSLIREPEPTDLQKKLAKVAGLMVQFGMWAAGLLLVILTVRYLVEEGNFFF